MSINPFRVVRAAFSPVRADLPHLVTKKAGLLPRYLPLMLRASTPLTLERVLASEPISLLFLPLLGKPVIFSPLYSFCSVFSIA